MKKTILLLVFTLCALSTMYAQGPFKYQAVIRDNSGNILPNKNVGLRLSILQGTTPAMVYREEQNKTSDQFGVINVEVGTGSVLNGNYLTIDWGVVNNQLQVDIDMNGGTTYTLLGTSPILYAPIANYAVKAGGATFPAGLIMPFAGDVNKIPAGWLLCDGSAKSRTQYADLFAAIDINWGAGDLTSTFNLPDLRGQFLRGVDSTAGVDPDASSRINKYNGGNTGNKVGSFQGDDLKSHNHGLNQIKASPFSGNPGYLGPNCNSSTWDNTMITNNTGGNETRSKNAYVLYIIKY